MLLLLLLLLGSFPLHCIGDTERRVRPLDTLLRLIWSSLRCISSEQSDLRRALLLLLLRPSPKQSDREAEMGRPGETLCIVVGVRNP